MIWRGYSIPAPGFDSATFSRAIDRAFQGGYQIAATDRAGVYRVHRPDGATYWTSRHGCSCPAGQTGRPCKHRAIVSLAEVMGVPPSRAGPAHVHMR